MTAVVDVRMILGIKFDTKILLADSQFGVYE
jgi:hypothetical protein